jgi:CMP/dCMP kinase
MNQANYVITISHQLGSGGAFLGQQLSKRLGIPFIDREIIKRVADQIHLAEAEVARREERLSSLWDSLVHMTSMFDPANALSSDRYVPTDQELFQIEADTILRIAEKGSAIFIGRCTRCILSTHPRHVSLLVHASLPARVDRLCNLYQLSAEEAKKLAETNDRERTAYIRSCAHEDCFDARLYDLCLDSSSLGLIPAADLAVACVQAKYHL